MGYVVYEKNNMKEKIEIPLSMWKLLFGVGGSILFVMLGIWLFLTADGLSESSSSLMANPMLRKIVGIANVLFFGATGIFGVSKFFKNNIGLSIDKNGIHDNSNASSVGLVEWGDIEDVKTHQVASTKFLMLHVSDPEKYISKAKNKMIEKLMRGNMKMYGTPVSITSNTLKINFSKLEELVRVEFEKNKKIN